ncbi:MAG TPA: hypothetical protein VM095_08610 [Pyrinomonadaceae bacterium]|nr:hypothetical protein [Pyrinomonadaceae bacterium]
MKNCTHLQEAAQECARLLYEEFEESIVLVRMFMTLPFRVLTPRGRSFVTELAGTKNLQHLLNDKTQILSLLGTYGEQPEWRDRFQSRGHLGIPLLSASFVESIPMVSRLMSDMGISADWFDETEQDVLVKSLGRAAGVFYVRDARTWLDHQNRKIVSAQDFVEEYGVKTVFGLGGSYLNGSFVTIIVFTHETIEQARAEAFMSMINTFKVATMRQAMEGLIFP